MTRSGIATCFLAFTFAIAIAAQPQKSPQAISSQHVASEDRVDINTASLEQMLKVPGMTRPWAARIIRFRPYRAKNEILDRGVVTSGIYVRVKDYIIAHRPNQ